MRQDASRIVARVVHAQSEAPIPHAEVTLRAGQERPYIAVTDERGEIEFAAGDVPARLGDKVFVLVKDEQGHARLRTFAVIGPGIVLRVPPKLVLRGEIVLSSGGSPAGLSVSAWTPPYALHGVEQFVAHQELGEDGRFEIAAGMEQVPSSFTLRVGGVGVPASRRVPTRELLSATGARVVIGLARLSIATLEDDGAAITNAHVRCIATESTDGNSALFAEAVTGTDGRAHMWVPTGVIGVAAGSPDHAPAREDVRVESDDLEVVLRLRRLSAADRLIGSVVFEDESPVPGALVSAWCADDAGELAVASMSQQRTNEKGAFEIAIAVDRALRVYAFHEGHGDAAEQGWNPGDGPVRLVIDRGVSLSVVARGLAVEAVSGANDVEVVLVRDDGRSESAGTDAFPVDFERLPPGRWRAFAIARHQRRWAAAETVVTREKPADLVLDFVPLDFVEGLVQPAPDPARQVSIVYTPSGWPEEAVQALLTTTLAPDGSFQIACPAPGEVLLREGPRTIERRSAAGGGARLVITLPD
ncbi:MAG: hypothetical protein NTY35_11160 [Planctomycetota bacterium]|nr:hypothetical protein [Planctomycetota bacterium]